MTSIEKIKAPVAADLARYESFLRTSLHSEHKLTQAMLDYIFETRGKGIRPLLVLLSAGMHNHGKKLPQKSYLAAMLIEMVHTASLVHDDVIDEADLRRGQPSVNAKWNSKRSVIIGDYILAKSFTTGMQSGAYELVGYITNGINALCEGELIQSEQNDLLEMTREIYFDIISKKTATLIRASCGAGAMSVGAGADVVNAMRQFGDNIGMAFQIKDDILDYSPSEKTGKPLCGDLREGKITLPLLLLMETADARTREEIKEHLRKAWNSPASLEHLHAMVTNDGGLDRAAEVMNEYVDRARNGLRKFPESVFRNSLDDLCLYIAERDK